MTPPKRKLTVKRAGTTDRSGGKLIQRTAGLGPRELDAAYGARADSIREIIGSAPDEMSAMEMDALGRAKRDMGAAGLFRVVPAGMETPGRAVVPDEGPKAVISLKTGLKDDFLPQVVAHELGHYAGKDPRMPRIAGVLMGLPPADAGAKYATGQYGPLAKRNEDNYRNPKPTPDPYAMESPEERRAQAFANAFALLQDMGRDTTDYRGRFGAAEATVPGTGDVAKGMLREPIYANHPLRKLIR